MGGFSQEVLSLESLGFFFSIWIVSFFRERIFARIFETVLHMGFCYWLFFRTLEIKTTILTLFAFATLQWILADRLKNFSGVRWVLVIMALMPLILNRTMGSISMAEWSYYFGSWAPRVVGLSGLHLAHAIPGLSYFAFRNVVFSTEVRTLKKPLYLLDYYAFIFFVPSFLIGPMSSFELFQQGLHNIYKRSRETYLIGFYRILWGLVKYFCLSAIFYQFTFSFYSKNGIQPAPLAAIVAVLVYPFYLYFNFSGFIDIMIGISSVLGISLEENFNRPYLAVNLADFWKRWHITLTQVLQINIFTPILFKFRAHQTIGYILGTVCVFGLMAWWHGSTYSFLVFGGLNAFGLIFNYFLRVKKQDAPLGVKIKRSLQYAILAVTIPTSFFFFENSWNRILEFVQAFNF